jgi:integrase
VEQGKDRRPEAPLKLREIWAIRVRLQLRSNLRELALFNLAIDSKLRACDLLSLRVGDIAHENHMNSRAIVMQRKARRPVQFEITETSQDARTKAALICRRTRNLRAVQLLLGHSKLESTVRYLGIEVDDALEISEQTEA